MIMRTLLLLAPLALCAGAATREGPAASSQEASAKPEKKLAELIARYDKQRSDVSAAYQKATTDAEKSAALGKLPGKEYVAEFRAIAEEAKGTDTAVKAWLWVLRLIDGDAKETKRVVDLLLSEHMRSEALGELTNYVRERDALRAMVAESPHERVRAAALTALGQVLLESKSASDKAEGRDCLEAVMAEYGELTSGNSTFGKLAERSLYELDHLQIGMTAPDFEATDENGVKWKLSDYRGKVVVVDFWGYW